LDGVRRVGVHPPIAFLAHPGRRRDHLLGGVELGHQTVDRRPAARPLQRAHRGTSVYSPPAVPPGTMVRISKIEIIGRKRMNRKSSEKNSPSVPMKVAQSQIVPEYIPHEDGRKSRCRLVTT